MRDNDLHQFENSSFIEVVGTRKAYEFFIASAAAYLLEAVNDVEHIQPLE